MAGNGPVIRISDAADQPWCLDSGVQRKLAAARRQLVLIEKHVEAQCLGFPGVVDDVQAHVVCAIAGRKIAEVVRSGIEPDTTHQLTVDHYLDSGRTTQEEALPARWPHKSEEHTSELQSLMRISYAVFCL